MKDSAAESNWICENVINPMFRFFGLEEVSDHVVRKIAHIAEFFLLSLFTTLFLRGKAMYSFPLCFVAAFLDETIQLFSNRGAQVQDIWIDLIGIAAGTLLAWLFGHMRKDTSEGSAIRRG